MMFTKIHSSLLLLFLHPIITTITNSLLLTLLISTDPSIILPVRAAPSSSSSSSYKYSTYNYDLTTPMFTPDGRLLQVEYAGNAPRHSFPLIAIAIQNDYLKEEKEDDDEDEEHLEDVIVMATLLSSPPKMDGKHQEERNEEEEDEQDLNALHENDTKDQHERMIQSKKIPIHERITRAQKRIVSLPTGRSSSSSSSSSSWTSKITGGGGILMGLSGVLSDNVALLTQVHQHIESWNRQYGEGSSKITTTTTTTGNTERASTITMTTSTALRIANCIGDACQNHSFGGGIRPFGASTIICAMESDLETTNSKMAMYTTHPSGSVWKHSFSTLNSKIRSTSSASNRNNHNQTHSKSMVVIIGGEESQKERMQQYIHTRLHSTATTSTSIQKAVKTAILAIYKEYYYQYPTQEQSISFQNEINDKNVDNDDNDDNDDGTAAASSNAASSNDYDDEKVILSNFQNHAAPLLEIAVLTCNGGVQYLDQDDLNELIQSMIATKRTTTT